MDRCRRGIVDVDVDTNRVTSFVEKPRDNSQTSSCLACPVFYIFNASTLTLITTLVEEAAARSLSSSAGSGGGADGGGSWNAHMSGGALMEKMCAQTVPIAHGTTPCAHLRSSHGLYQDLSNENRRVLSI